jgi:3-deoxy-D-manno-octulosonate 8-phosphate phosphatase (KDO 8-P phosphatase)
MQAGIQVGIITARQSKALQHRCDNLGIDLVFQGMRDKAAAMERIQERTGVPPKQMAYMGDDVLDLPMFARVGLAIAVADAHPYVLKQADMVTTAKGGEGAVREICDAILSAQGFLDGILARYGR